MSARSRSPLFIRETKCAQLHLSTYGPQDRPIPPDQATPFEGIDFMLLTSLQMKEMGGQGLLKELPTVRLPGLEGALPEVVHDLSTDGGKRLGLPVGLSPVLIAANQKGLSSAWISLPPLDWTWGDCEQAATAAVQAGQSSQLDGEYLSDSTLRSYGGRVYDSGRAAWMLNTPESVQDWRGSPGSPRPGQWQ